MENARKTRTPGADNALEVETVIDAADQAGEAQAMPNAIDVDPTAIKSPTLTKQGWVLPVKA